MDKIENHCNKKLDWGTLVLFIGMMLEVSRRLHTMRGLCRVIELLERGSVIIWLLRLVLSLYMMYAFNFKDTFVEPSLLLSPETKVVISFAPLSYTQSQTS